MSSVSHSWKQALKDCGGIITQKVDHGGNVVLIMIQTQMIVIICFAFIVIIY